MRTVVLILLTAFSGAAAATPVYLDCQIINTAGGVPGPSVHSHIALNEETQSVTFVENADLDESHAMGRATTYPAEFTQDAVTFTEHSITGLVEVYKIDRGTLAFTGTYTFPGSPSNHGSGSCKIAKATKRQF